MQQSDSSSAVVVKPEAYKRGPSAFKKPRSHLRCSLKTTNPGPDLTEDACQPPRSAFAFDWLAKHDSRLPDFRRLLPQRNESPSAVRSFVRPRARTYSTVSADCCRRAASLGRSRSPRRRGWACVLLAWCVCGSRSSKSLRQSGQPLLPWTVCSKLQAPSPMRHSLSSPSLSELRQ
jgi:hypothetical protein